MQQQLGREIRFSAYAFRDLSDISDWSVEHFGLRAAERYESLLTQALLDLAAEPERPGAKSRNEIASGAWLYHIASSRDRVTGERVKTPRHVILYRVNQPGILDILRILHDTQDPRRHLPEQM